MRHGILFGGLAFLLSASALFADTVFLRSGQAVYGQIVSQSRTDIRISVQGQVRVIRKVDVARVQFDDPNAAKQADDERKKQEAERLRQEELRRRTAEEEQKRIDAQRKADEEKKARDRRAAEEDRTPERRRHYLEASVGLIGGAYSSGMESNVESLQTFLNRNGGSLDGSLSYMNHEADGFGGLSLDAKYFWNRWFATAYASGIRKEQKEARFLTQTSGREGQSGRMKLENGYTLYSHNSVRRRANIGGGWFPIYTEKLELSVGGGLMAYTTYVKGDSPSLGQNVVENSSFWKFSHDEKMMYQGKGWFFMSGAAYSLDSIPSWITIDLQLYRTKGVVRDQLANVTQPFEVAVLELAAPSVAGGVDVLPGFRYKVREDLEVGAQLRFETMKIVPGKLAFTRFDISSTTSGIKPVDILLFAALFDISPEHKRPYRDKFSGITFSVQKRFDFGGR